MISLNETTCVPKIAGCEVSFADQPTGLEPIQINPDGISSNGDEYEVYTCPKCKDGYYKDNSGICQLCSFSPDLQEGEPTSCLECLTSQRCTKCAEGLILTYLEDGCQLHIDNCDVTYENYINDGTQYICPDCAYGYFSNHKDINLQITTESKLEYAQCLECGQAHCSDCQDKNICLECDAGYWLSPDSLYCLPKIDHCVSSEDTKLALDKDKKHYLECT